MSFKSSNGNYTEAIKAPIGITNCKNIAFSDGTTQSTSAQNLWVADPSNNISYSNGDVSVADTLVLANPINILSSPTGYMNLGQDLGNINTTSGAGGSKRTVNLYEIGGAGFYLCAITSTPDYAFKTSAFFYVNQGLDYCDTDIIYEGDLFSFTQSSTLPTFTVNFNQGGNTTTTDFSLYYLKLF